MAIIIDSEAWRNFFKAYRELPELWNANCADFKNRDKKHNSWLLLLEKYKAVDKDATLEGLKSRLNNIRYCYRRELRKVSKSEKAGARFGEVRVPSLWYYGLLDFLRDQEQERSTTESDDDDSTSLSIPPSKKRSSNFNDQSMLPIVDPLDIPREPPRDDAAVYAEGWTYSFRKLSPEQQLMAKKAIDEILLLGILGKLTFNSVDFSVAMSQSQYHHNPRVVSQPQHFSQAPSSLQETDNDNYDYCSSSEAKIEDHYDDEIL